MAIGHRNLLEGQVSYGSRLKMDSPCTVLKASGLKRAEWRRYEAVMNLEGAPDGSFYHGKSAAIVSKGAQRQHQDSLAESIVLFRIAI